MQEVAEHRPALDFEEIARAVLFDAGSDRNQALVLGQQRIRQFLVENPERAIEVVMPLLSNKLWDALRVLAPDGRKKSAHPPGGSGGHAGRGLEALGRDYLYAFVLPSGQKLGEADRDDVERARRIFAAGAQENTRNALWLAAIARELTQDKTVKEAFSEERLAKMLKGAKQDAAATLGPKARELTTR